MTKVFILAPNERFQSDSAQHFGTVIHLFKSEAELNSMGGQETVLQIGQELENAGYCHEDDFIAITGNVNSVVWFAIAASGFSEEGRVKTLIFDARSQSYTPRSVMAAPN